jgi:quercetin dioxygenase-like cupin family protein
MHRTTTVDYIIVLKGEIYAIMDKDETLLRAGDILVQRGTNHSWSVRTNEPCIIAAVLVNAKPLKIFGKKPAAKKSKSKPKAKKRK